MAMSVYLTGKFKLIEGADGQRWVLLQSEQGPVVTLLFQEENQPLDTATEFVGLLNDAISGLRIEGMRTGVVPHAG
jgi:hypothetical protein